MKRAFLFLTLFSLGIVSLYAQTYSIKSVSFRQSDLKQARECNI